MQQITAGELLWRLQNVPPETPVNVTAEHGDAVAATDHPVTGFSHDTESEVFDLFINVEA